MKKCYRMLILYPIILLLIKPVQGISLIKEKNISYKELCVYVTKICFNWGDESGAITLTDCDENKTPLKTPEFDISLNQNNPAAYIRNNYITMKVKFESMVMDIFSISIKASGALGGLNEKEVFFINGESDWIYFTTNEPLPDTIKTYNIQWNWFYYNEDTELWEDFYKTYHTIYSLNKKPLTSKVFENLSRWTTKWCEDLIDDDKIIADAILNGFVENNVIQYGGKGHTAAEILRTGDGMCGGMGEVFFNACATQGVMAVGFYFLLPKPNEYISDRQIIWEGIVCQDPGLGRTVPGHDSKEETWKWVDEKYPYPSYYGLNNENDDVNEECKIAYIFYRGDGHMVNLLKYKEEIYLYDLSFGKGPYKDTFEFIPIKGVYTSSLIQNFRKNYHDIAVDHMYGRIYYKNKAGDYVLDETNFTVKTSIIPNKVFCQNQILYYLNTTKFNTSLYKSIISDINFEYERYFNNIYENSDEFKISDNEKNLIEKWLQNPSIEIDWLELREAISKLGNSKELNEISYAKNILYQILKVKTDINIAEGCPLPGLMSPLNMVKSVAISSLKYLYSNNNILCKLNYQSKVFNSIFSEIFNNKIYIDNSIQKLIDQL